MTTSDLIEAIATAAYSRGAHPLEVGEALIEILCEEVLGVPERDPRGTVLARRVLGGLSDAGWAMPGRAGRTAP